MVLIFSGCMTTRKIEPLSYYTITPNIQVEIGETTTATLGIRPLLSARHYNLAMAYQRDDHILEYRHNAQWAEQPSATITRAIRDTLIATNRFADVGLATEMARPDFLLTGEVRKFHEHITNATSSAELEVRIEIRRARDIDVLLAHTFYSRVPMEESSPEAFAAAIGKALQEMTVALSEKLNSLTIM